MALIENGALGSLRINRMILHVVGGNRFEAQPERAVEFDDFFLERIRETNVDPVHVFNEDSETKQTLQSIASGAEGFEQGTHRLSRRFHDLHVGSSIHGAFFVFELTCDDANLKFYSLIKYDFREALEQRMVDDEAHLRRIVNALISDRKAVQKSAIIKIENGVAVRAIAARDRTKVPPDIGDYFATFLDVMRDRSNAELTKAAVTTIKEALKQCRDLLPDENIPNAFQRAKTVLRDQQLITEEAIAAAMLAAANHPDDEIAESRLRNAARRRVAANKLEGLEFRPNRQYLGRPQVRRIKTVENVMLEFPDDLEGNVVTRDDEGDETVFTIRTQEVREDGFARNRAR